MATNTHQQARLVPQLWDNLSLRPLIVSLKRREAFSPKIKALSGNSMKKHLAFQPLKIEKLMLQLIAEYQIINIICFKATRNSNSRKRMQMCLVCLNQQSEKNPSLRGWPINS